MAVEQIDKVGWCLVVEGFVSEEEYFELNLLSDGKPVEFLEDVGDVVTGADVGEQAGSRVLDVLKFIEDFGRCAEEDAGAVVNSGSDEGVDQSFCSREGEWWTETGYVFEVEESSFGDLIYVLLKREIVVKNDSEVVTVWGRGEGGVVYSEAEVVSVFDEGFGADDDYVWFVTV